MMAKRTWLALLFAVTTATPAFAHEGPPYPAIVDRQAGPYVLSVWTDPDVGTGTFFVIFDPPTQASETDPRVFIEVAPASGRLPAVRVEAHLQPDHAYRAEVPFDREEQWNVLVHVTGSLGSGGVSFPVEVTPPGYGRWDLLIYLTPFLVLGGLWALVSIKKRKMARAERGATVPAGRGD